MRIENSKYILCFLIALLLGSYVVKSDRISYNKVKSVYVEDNQLQTDNRSQTLSEDSKKNDTDIYRRTGSNNPVVPNNGNVIYNIPVINFQSFIHCSVRFYFLYFRTIKISLTVQDLIYPFNYFL
ncbi:MAG: hypothetical protein LBV74_02175 [Tannerella sp.]|jgi:hypothetical protein|nr:hypothetical protein [Tannerella sp.]